MMRLFCLQTLNLLLLAALTDVGLAAESGAPGASEILPRLTAPQMRDDLVFLRDVWRKQDKSFSSAQTEELNQVLNEAIEHADRLDPVLFWMTASRAVALSRNGHTNIDADNPPFPGLSFKAWWFPDGLYIVQAAPAWSQLLGARIDRIGTRSAEQALAAVTPFIAGNDRRIRNVSPAYLRIPALLHRLGMTRSDTEVRLTLRLRDGKAKKVSLGVESATGASQHGGDDRPALVPTDMDVTGRWVHVLDSVKERPAIYQKPVDADYRWLGEGHRTLYIRSNQISDCSSSLSAPGAVMCAE
jgi:hypothetical protein